MSIAKEITSVNLFNRKIEGDKASWGTGHFVGRPYRISYNSGHLLVADAWKQRAGGIPQGCFLLAYYDNEISDKQAQEAVLLRVIKASPLPTDPEVIRSMVEYYKDDIRTGSSKGTQLDSFTRYEFSFSGLECTVLGSFYLDEVGGLRFGADLENFYSAHNYSVVKPQPEVLRFIVNYREKGQPGGQGDIRIGRIRYSSRRRFQVHEPEVPVYVHSQDLAGKRTALFGMTRTGKSNTVKKIIQSCVEMSVNAPLKLDTDKEGPDEVLKPFTEDNNPKYPIGQIIFDINGEYANPNLQDQGTAIFDLYKDLTVRYSTLKKAGFKEMKVNFFSELEEGFDLICSYPSIAEDDTRFVTNFRNVSLAKPDDYDSNASAKTRYDRRLAVYVCCLYRAGFEVPKSFEVKFQASADVRKAVWDGEEPNKGMTLEDAATWWEKLWEIYDDDAVFTSYKQKNKREWADDDLKALLTILTRKRSAGEPTNCPDFRTFKTVIPH